MKLPNAVISLALAVLLAGCQSQNDRHSTSSSRPTTKPTEFTGTLQSGIAAIGGEHTGWVLAGDGSSGGIEVDVSRVRADAKANAGKRVTISGRMSEKNYVERGKTPILIAERITPAPKPEAPRPPAQ